MTEYEIRILGADGQPTLISEWVYLNLSAAIISAKRMSNGAVFEVWWYLRPYQQAHSVTQFCPTRSQSSLMIAAKKPNAVPVEYDVVF
jgi:hypothetical protein